MIPDLNLDISMVAAPLNKDDEFWTSYQVAQ